MPQKTDWYYIAAVVLLLILVACLFTGRFQLKRPSPFSVDILERSKRYVENFGAKRRSELSGEQRLLLLHAYYNLGQFDKVVEISEFMETEIEALPPERRKPFLQMVEEAYIDLGRHGRAIKMRDQKGKSGGF